MRDSEKLNFDNNIYNTIRRNIKKYRKEKCNPIDYLAVFDSSFLHLEFLHNFEVFMYKIPGPEYRKGTIFCKKMSGIRFVPCRERLKIVFHQICVTACGNDFSDAFYV